LLSLGQDCLGQFGAYGYGYLLVTGKWSLVRLSFSGMGMWAEGKPNDVAISLRPCCMMSRLQWRTSKSTGGWVSRQLLSCVGCVVLLVWSSSFEGVEGW